MTRLSLLLISLLVGCTPVHWPEKQIDTRTITWERVDRVNESLAYPNGTGCTIKAVEPKHWSDREMVCLAHEVMHCFGGEHKREAGC